MFAIRSLSPLYTNYFDALGAFCHFAKILGHKWPNLEYACASGMSFLALDTKGDLARNYGDDPEPLP